MSINLQITRQNIIFIFLIVLFVGAYTQKPLFHGDQNTYFVHGLAHAGVGLLKHDWLANTTDHIPVFTQLIAQTYRHISPYMFYVYHALLIAVYILSLSGIISYILKIRYDSSEFLFSFAMLIFIHCYPIHNFILRLPGLWRISFIIRNLPRLTDGLAGQYILGSSLQPCSFGILLIASILLFLHKKNLLPVVVAVIAAIIHPSYLLHAGLLTIGFILALIIEKRFKEAIGTGIIALFMVMPTIIYSLINFRPTTSNLYAQYQLILADFRIPHHTNFFVWFKISSIVQLSIIFLALLIAKKDKRFFCVFSVLLIGGALMTVAQIITGNKTLALLFPWRISVLLVPVSSVLLISYIITTLNRRYGRLLRHYYLLINVIIIISILIMSGLGIIKTVKGISRSQKSEAMVDYVKNNSTISDVYLIPPNLETFRLSTAVPVYVDFKSHPYKDIEFLEWYKRIRLSQSFYASSNTVEAHSTLNNILDEYNVSKIVILKNGASYTNHVLGDIEYRDEKYLIIKIN